MILTFLLFGGAEGDRTPDLMTARPSGAKSYKRLNRCNILTFLGEFYELVSRLNRQKRPKKTPFLTVTIPSCQKFLVEFVPSVKGKSRIVYW